MLTFLKAENTAEKVRKKKLTVEAGELINQTFRMNKLLRQKYKAYLTKIGMIKD
jgi:hypothetical protein